MASVWAESIATLPEVAAPMASDRELSAGGELTWAIGGFEPVESVVLILASKDRVTLQLLDEEISDTRGNVVLTGVLPVNLNAGPHDLVAFAPVSGIGYRAPVTVDASGVVASGWAGFLAAYYAGGEAIPDDRQAALLSVEAEVFFDDDGSGLAIRIFDLRTLTISDGEDSAAAYSDITVDEDESIVKV